MFMTDDQKKYYKAMKNLQSKKPTKGIPMPKVKPINFVSYCFFMMYPYVGADPGNSDLKFKTFV